MQTRRAGDNTFKGVYSLLIPTSAWLNRNAIKWSEHMRTSTKLFITMFLRIVELIGKKSPSSANSNKKQKENETRDQEEIEQIIYEHSEENTHKPIIYMQTLNTNTTIPFYLIHIFLKNSKDDFIEASYSLITELAHKTLSIEIEKKKSIKDHKRKRVDDEITDLKHAKSLIIEYLAILDSNHLQQIDLKLFKEDCTSMDKKRVSEVFSKKCVLALLKAYKIDTSTTIEFYDNVENTNPRLISALKLNEQCFEKIYDLRKIVSDEKLPYVKIEDYKKIMVFEMVKRTPLIDGITKKLASADTILENYLLDELYSGKRKFNDILNIYQNYYQSDFKMLTKTYSECKNYEELTVIYSEKYFEFFDEKINSLLSMIGPESPTVFKSLYTVSMLALFKFIQTNRCNKDRYFFFQNTFAKKKLIVEKEDNDLTKIEKEGIGEDFKFERKMKNRSGIVNFFQYMENVMQTVEYAEKKTIPHILLGYTTLCSQFDNFNGERLYIWFQGCKGTSKSFGLKMLLKYTPDDVVSERTDLGSDYSDISETLDNFSANIYDEGFDPSKDKNLLNNLKTMMTNNLKERRVLITDNNKKDHRYTIQYICEKKFVMLSASNYQLGDEALSNRQFVMDVLPSKKKETIPELKYTKQDEIQIDPVTHISSKSISKDLHILASLTYMAITMHAQFEPTLNVAHIVILDIYKYLYNSNIIIEYESRDFQRILHLVKSLVIMNSWVEVMLLNSSKYKGRSLSCEIILEAAKHQFATLEISVLAFSMVFESIQNPKMNAIKRGLTQREFPILNDIKNFYIKLFNYDYTYSNDCLNYDTHLWALFAWNKNSTSHYKIRTIKCNNEEKVDFNYITLKTSSETAAMNIIKICNSNHYIYEINDYKLAIKSNKSKMFRPKKVFKLKSLDDTKMCYDGLTYENIEEMLLEIYETLEINPLNMNNEKIDNIARLILEKRGCVLEECENGNYLYDGRIYNESQGLPIILIENYGNSQYSISFLIEWLCRSNPIEIFRDSILNLSKYVVKEETISIVTKNGLKRIDLKPQPYTIEYYEKDPNYKGTYEDDELNLMDEEEDAISHYFKKITKDIDPNKHGVYIINRRYLKKHMDKYGFISMVHKSTIEDDVESMQDPFDINWQSQNENNDTDTPLGYKYIKELKNNPLLHCPYGIDDKFAAMHLEKYLVHGTAQDEYINKKYII